MWVLDFAVNSHRLLTLDISVTVSAWAALCTASTNLLLSVFVLSKFWMFGDRFCVFAVDNACYIFHFFTQDTTVMTEPDDYNLTPPKRWPINMSKLIVLSHKTSSSESYKRHIYFECCNMLTSFADHGQLCKLQLLKDDKWLLVWIVTKLTEFMLCQCIWIHREDKVKEVKFLLIEISRMCFGIF